MSKFQEVMALAEEKRAVRDRHTEEVRIGRVQEVIDLCREADLALDRRTKQSRNLPKSTGNKYYG